MTLYDNVLDALILLPSLGFPAIAEYDIESNTYKIFVSMLLSVYKKSGIEKIIPNILRVESFNTHYDDENWPYFDHTEKVGKAKFCPKPLSNKNKIFWYSQNPKEPDIELFRKSFRAAIRSKFRDMVSRKTHEVHREFILELPNNYQPTGQSNMLNLVCLHERKQLHEYLVKKRIFQGMSEKDRSFLHRIPHLTLTFQWMLKSIDEGSHNLMMSNDRPVIPYHPIYIPPKDKKYLNIAHLSDTHVSSRWEAMHYWSRVRINEQQKWQFHMPQGPLCVITSLTDARARAKEEAKVRELIGKKDFHKFPHWKRFNNPNRRFEEALEKTSTNPNVDIIIITGDLIDYSLGYTSDYHNVSYLTHFTDCYSSNHNWLVFYELLLKYYDRQRKQDKNKMKPVFTVLGNHDYRIGIYGLYTEGQLAGQNYADSVGIDVEKSKGFEQQLHYTAASTLIYPLDLVRFSPERFYDERSLEVAKGLLPSYDAIQLYNFIINPALDYVFQFGNMTFVFLDWREGERIFDSRGRECAIKMRWWRKWIGCWPRKFGTPWAKYSLTENQKEMISNTFYRNKGNIIVISMHATVFCTPESFYHGGFIVSDEERKENIREHLALGNLNKYREWLVRSLIKADRMKGTCTIVLSGHTHKNRLYQVIESAVAEFEKTHIGILDRSKELKSDKQTHWWANRKFSPFFIVTTSTAFRYDGDGFEKRGYRIINFTEDEVGTKLCELKIPENQGLSDDKELPLGHPRRS